MRLDIHIIPFLIASLFVACTDSRTNNDRPDMLDRSGLKPAMGLKYAQRFSVAENEHCRAVLLFGASNIHDTSCIYILPKDSSYRPACRENEFLVSHTNRIISLSSVYSNMIALLGEHKRIVAIENSDYYSEKNILQGLAEKSIMEVNKDPEPDIERILLLKPDLIFSFGSLNSSKWPDKRITRAGIPTLVAFDHLEETPLARAEWIKLFGVFLGKERMADSLFRSVEENYHRMKKYAAHAKTQPGVLTEIKTGDLWYVPGGKSFAATLLKDAGANYIWQNDEHSGSLPLDLETVYAKAADADVWLNLPMIKNKSELASLDKRYTHFKAYQNGELYNNTKNINAKGYSDYWETGIIFPDKVLSDLIQILHPELRDSIKKDLYYYKKLD